MIFLRFFLWIDHLKFLAGFCQKLIKFFCSHRGRAIFLIASLARSLRNRDCTSYLEAFQLRLVSHFLPLLTTVDRESVFGEWQRLVRIFLQNRLELHHRILGFSPSSLMNCLTEFFPRVKWLEIELACRSLSVGIFDHFLAHLVLVRLWDIHIFSEGLLSIKMGAVAR